MKLVDLILLKPNENWDWEQVASNPNISMADAKLLNQCGLKVDLSRNVYLEITDIIDNLKYNWEFHILSHNPNMTPKIKEEYRMFRWWTRYGDEWRTIPLEYAIKNCPSNHIIIIANRLMNEDFDMDDIITTLINLDNLRSKVLYWSYLFANKNFTVPLMKKHIDKIEYGINYNNSSINKCSRNPNLNIDLLNEILIGNYDPRWDLNWDDIQRNPGITVQDMFNNPGLPWNGTWPDNDENPIFNAEWWLNPNVTPNDLIEHGKLEQKYWKMVSINTPISYILKNIHYPWDWDQVSSNSSLTVNVIANNPHIPWNYQNISKNHMIQPIEYYTQDIKRYIHIQLIIQDLNKVISEYV